MPIETLKFRPRELGRIRTGERRESSTGQQYPAKLERFRFTSPDKAVIQSVGDLYGGEVRDWDNSGKLEYQVIIDSPTVDVMLPPPSIEIISQWYELWARSSGNVRRCTGIICTETTEGPDGPVQVKTDCLCEANNKRECTAQTRILLMLPHIPDIGVFRLETGSIFAAQELPPAIELARTFGGSAPLGVLALEPRERKQPGQPMHKFAVPVLRVRYPTNRASQPLLDPSTGEVLGYQPQAALPVSQTALPVAQKADSRVAALNATLEQIVDGLDKGEIRLADLPQPLRDRLNASLSGEPSDQQRALDAQAPPEQQAKAKPKASLGNGEVASWPDAKRRIVIGAIGRAISSDEAARLHRCGDYYDEISEFMTDEQIGGLLGQRGAECLIELKRGTVELRTFQESVAAYKAAGGS